MSKAHHMFSNRDMFKAEHKPKNRSSKHIKLMLAGRKSPWSQLSTRQLESLDRYNKDPEIQYELRRRAAKHKSNIE